ncbi:TetR/AcrR family transcriptional regulator [Micromonospora sp. NPDC050980]|uniref:TetR/AcrR family transcriptional regulator n=1 Tax=Micromonospora sp. NPDC050980 TaxID=3155161 RepID=UPI0033C042F0
MSGKRTYGGLSVEERLAHRRRRLLDAGLELFASRGFHGTSIEQLSSAAGITARDFYRVFKGREELFIALLDELNDESVRVAAEALSAAAEDAVARARAALSAYIQWTVADPRRARVKYTRPFGISPAVERRRQAGVDAFIDLARHEFEQMAAAGLIPRRTNFALAAVAVMGAANELILDWVAGRYAADIDEVVEEAVRVLGAALSGP